MQPSLHDDLTLSWLIRSLVGTFIVPLMGGMIIYFFWEAFPPHGLSLAYGIGWVIATLALWIYMARSPLKIYLSRRKGALEINAEGIRINGAFIPFTMIEKTLIGTSPFRKTDYRAALEGKAPRFENGSLMGPRLYVYLKKENQLSTIERTDIFLLCPSSFIWDFGTRQYIIIESLTFSIPLRTIQHEIDQHIPKDRAV